VLVIGRAPVLEGVRTLLIGLALFAAGRDGWAAGLEGAGLEGGGEEFFFWAPHTSAEVNISVKSTNNFLGIPLSDIFNLRLTAFA